MTARSLETHASLRRRPWTAAATAAAVFGACIVAFAAIAPTTAYACPTCFAGVENGFDYFLTFILLTVMPFIAGGGLLWWLRRRLREAEQASR